MMNLRFMRAGGLAFCAAALAVMLPATTAETTQAADTFDLLVVVPVRLDAHPQGAMMPNGIGCAIDIDDGQGPAQRVITVGEGETELLSCLRFVAAGPLPQPRSLGLIYDFESGPGRTFRAALIASQDSETGAWSMDEERLDLIVNGDIADLESLRSALESQ